MNSGLLGKWGKFLGIRYAELCLMFGDQHENMLAAIHKPLFGQGTGQSLTEHRLTAISFSPYLSLSILPYLVIRLLVAYAFGYCLAS